MDADKNMYHLKETKKEKKLVVIGKGGGNKKLLELFLVQLQSMV